MLTEDTEFKDKETKTSYKEEKVCYASMLSVCLVYVSACTISVDCMYHYSMLTEYTDSKAEEETQEKVCVVLSWYAVSVFSLCVCTQ